MKNLLLILLVICSTSCTEYWWTRGQPPSTSDLLERANDRFSTSFEQRSEKRADIANLAKSLTNSLNQSVNSTNANSLNKVQSDFIKLEGKLSIGSRAAYSELSKQIRAFSNNSSTNEGSVNKSAYRLFASRSIMFLASELKTPAPSF